MLGLQGSNSAAERAGLALLWTMACSAGLMPAASAQTAAPHPAPATEASVPKLGGGEEESAAAMLQDGTDAIAHGRTAAGQRLLELLIARYPESAAATVARRQLAAHYGAATPSALAPAARASEPGDARGARPADAWQVDVRRNAAAEADFRIRAGDRVFFAAASAELGGRARTVLAAQAKWLNRYSALDVVVEGHADDPGGPEANRQIARARAEAVRSRLIEEGVAADRIAIAVRGNVERVAECASAICAAQNRRVVVVVIATEPDARPAASTGGKNDGADALRLSGEGRHLPR